MTGVFFFDPDVLSDVADRHRIDYPEGRPFPHVVIDGLVPEGILDEVVRESPEPQDRDDWLRANRTDAIKLSIPHDWALGPMTRHLLNQFNSAVFVNFLEQLTGIDGLIPDPHYLGGGLHQIERGGFLKIHADFNRHAHLQLDRRLNVLLYLNRDWQDEWGGLLEMWDEAMTHKVREIAPLFNRVVIFGTNDKSYHGHPDPLRCPPGTRRRSLALYYYTNGRPEHEQSEAHSTLHQVRPGEDFDPGPPPTLSRPTSPPLETLAGLQQGLEVLRADRGALIVQHEALTKELDRPLYRVARRIRRTIEQIPLAERVVQGSLRIVDHKKVRQITYVTRGGGVHEGKSPAGWSMA